MKTFYTLLFTILYFSASTQLIITEISYNPPEAGTDSLEYIELYNASDVAFNLEGSSFSDGITHEFGAEMIEAESYLCVALNAEAMQNVFGKTCIQWTSGALKNGGELIRLVDSNGDELDAVDFLPGDPWPSSSEGTNGNGASIVLCDLQADNSLPESWSAAANDIGVEINGKVVKGSPGEDNTISCSITPDYTIEALPNNTFSPADITINPGETIQWINSGGNHNINGDKSTFPDNPESFGNGAPSSSAWVYNHTFFIEGVYEYQCDPHSGLGMTGTITVGIPKTFPRYEIAVLRTVDDQGIVDSLGKSCEIVGTVHGVNLSTSGGLLFFLIDENGDGISVYTQNNTLGYTVNEGDELAIRGTVGQFNGLTQFNAETVNVNGTGTLQTPIVVDSIYEANEAKLVKLENFTFVDEMDWRGDGSSFNIQVTNGEYTTTMRITEFTDLANMSAPQGPFNLIGLVNQYDFNEPYLEFYQLFPRSSADIEEVSSTNSVQYTNLRVSPNPTQGILFIEGMEQPEQVQLIQMNGSTLKTWDQPGNLLDLQVDNGVYILCVIKGSERQYQKVIVTK